MTLLKEISDEKHEEYIFPCECHDWHYLRLTWDEDPKYRALWVEDAYRPRQWRDKVKVIWSVLWNRPACYTEVILTPATVESLLETLNGDSK